MTTNNGTGKILVNLDDDTLEAEVFLDDNLPPAKQAEENDDDNDPIKDKGETKKEDKKEPKKDDKPKVEEEEGEENNNDDDDEEQKPKKDADKKDKNNEDEGNDNSDELSAVAKISSELEVLGIELKDEEGNPLEFDNTIEGVIELVKQAVPKAVNARLDAFFENNPDIYAYALHKQSGGTEEEWAKQSAIRDLSSIKIDEDTEDSVLEKIYRTELKNKGMDEDEIEDAIDLAKDKGKLYDRAVKAQSAIKKANEEKIKAQESARNAQIS